MRFRGSVAIDLGTVNTLVWVAGRGIVLEEPTARPVAVAAAHAAMARFLNACFVDRRIARHSPSCGDSTPYGVAKRT